MKYPRSSGILLHPTSLPGPYGIGDLGPAALRFVDFLQASGCKLWQILPLGPTGYGDSPYQSFSAFAGNPYVVSPELLLADGLLIESDLADHPEFPADRVDFGRLIPWKLSLLERAFSRLASNSPRLRKEFSQFCIENKAWLDDYSLFMALKESQGGGAWTAWPDELRARRSSALKKAAGDLAESISRFSFYQFLFFRQWAGLRKYANSKGIKIIGDIPIFVAHDSADVWANPELYYLNDQGAPTVVAGVPPDGFSPTGQLWGNPLYRWEVHKATGFAWWLERFRSALRQVDIIRMDHFRGFSGYWEIPAGNPTAEFGRWVPGPGADFFRAVGADLAGGQPAGDSTLPIIAEDLGLITPVILALRDEFHLPGMRILQFGFSGPDDPFLPHHYVENCVAYTGTHDNDTARGWFESAPEQEREFALRYLDTDGHDFAWDLIRAVWASVAVFAITQMQDALSLGGETRMNYPSRLGGNWEWRMLPEVLTEALRARLAELNYLYQR
jgi:4-alpha-glucanotransferase